MAAPESKRRIGWPMTKVQRPDAQLRMATQRGDRLQLEIDLAVARIRALPSRRIRVSLDDILSARDEGRKG